MDRDSFPLWIEEQMQAKHWKPADLAKHSGIDQGTLSNVLNRTRGVGLKFCTRLAHALDLSPETVLRQAQLLPPKPDADPTVEQIRHVAEELPEEQQRLLLSIARTMLEET